MRHPALLGGLPVTVLNCRRRDWGRNKRPKLTANCKVKPSLKRVMGRQAEVAAMRRDRDSSVLKASRNALQGAEQKLLQQSD